MTSWGRSARIASPAIDKARTAGRIFSLLPMSGCETQDESLGVDNSSLVVDVTGGVLRLHSPTCYLGVQPSDVIFRQSQFRGCPINEPFNRHRRTWSFA